MCIPFKENSSAFKWEIQMIQGMRKSEEKFANLSKYKNTLSTDISSVENLSLFVRKRYNGVRNEVHNT
jgi:hypothetical protein